jgi:hypothetical protein
MPFAPCAAELRGAMKCLNEQLERERGVREAYCPSKTISKAQTRFCSRASRSRPRAPAHAREGVNLGAARRDRLGPRDKQGGNKGREHDDAPRRLDLRDPRQLLKGHGA